MGDEVIGLLHSVTLGMSAAEIDYMFVKGRKIKEDDIPEKDKKSILKNAIIGKEKKRKLSKDNPAKYMFQVTEVLSIIECKANARDIVHNIPRMQSMLSWLTKSNQP